jgi:DNA-binding XRE family transcriptional regulator
MAQTNPSLTTLAIFAQNLTYLRERKGFKQQQMSNILCEACRETVSIKRYQSWEEARALPPLRITAKICDVLQFKDIYQLLTEKIEPHEIKKAI